MADLRVIDAEPLGQAVTKVLEEMLLRARRGDLSCIAIAFVERAGTVDWDWSDAPNTSTLVGAIERMKADLIRVTDA